MYGDNCKYAQDVVYLAKVKIRCRGLQYCYRTDILYTSPKSEAWLLLAVGR